MCSENNSYDQAKEAFESKEIQQSWRVHMGAFGPILEPAFADDYASRIHLTAALNFLSRRAADKALEKLAMLESSCLCDADRAALLYFTGLCYESSGDMSKMLDFYNAAAELGHRFYLPYLKSAKTYHQSASFDLAETNYAAAIECINEMQPNPQKNILLASALTNFATCLTAMHKYGTALVLYEKSKQLIPNFPGRAASEAILFAAADMEDKLSECLTALKVENPQSAAAAEAYTKTILNGEDAHFCLVPAVEGKLKLFWEWLQINENVIISLIDSGKNSTAESMINEQLIEAFPFMRKPLDITAVRDNGFCVITLSDGYALSLHEGFSQLLASKPESLSNVWKFRTVH